MNGACLGHRAILMQSMLQFVMHYGCYRHCYHYIIMQHQRRGVPLSTLMPAIDLAALLDDREENLKPEQMSVMHASVMELLGDPGNPLYAEPHSMAEHFDALLAGAHAIGELPGCTHCKDGDTTAWVYEDETTQVRQKILQCLDMRVMDRDLVLPTCLRTPTLILPTGCFMKLYFNLDNQGQYASQFPVDSQGFMQPYKDIRASIVPRDFRQLPADMRELVDQYFHSQELETKADTKEESMSTDMEAAETIRRLNLQCPESMESLQVAVCEALVLAIAARPTEEEYYYDSDKRCLISTNSSRSWQKESCSGRPPKGVLPLHCPGVHPTSASKNGPPLAGYLTYARCWIKLRQPRWPARSLYSQWLPCSCPSPAYGIWTISASCITTRQWPSGSLPHWKPNSASKPRHLPNQTPTTPTIEDEPRTQNEKVETGVAPESGVKRDRKNWTKLGCTAKAGNAVRVEGEARAADGEVRAGRDPRVAGTMRMSRAVGTR